MNDALHAPVSPANPENDFHFNGIIRNPTVEDLTVLQPILEHWIRDRITGALIPDEVADALSSIREVITDGPISGRIYRVAEDAEGKVIGVMGIQHPDEKMLPFVTPGNNAIELINAYVDPSSRSKGAGRALVEDLEKTARQSNFTEVIVNSGPRYKDSGWRFWTKMYGEPGAVAKQLYGPGGDAMIWKKSL